MLREDRRCNRMQRRQESAGEEKTLLKTWFAFLDVLRFTLIIKVTHISFPSSLFRAVCLAHRDSETEPTL